MAMGPFWRTWVQIMVVLTSLCVDVVAIFQQVGGQGVTEGVGADRPGDVGSACRLADCPLQVAFIQMVAAHDTPTRVYREMLGGEDILPCPFPVGRGRGTG